MKPVLLCLAWGVLLVAVGCRQSLVLTRHGNPPKKQQIYILPIPDGQEISAWCACRSVGTSPHIGRDVAQRGKGSFVSVALASGRVKSLGFIERCGWEVFFEDDFGVTWRYLHLNEPPVKVGQALSRGQIMGTHSQFPLAGCGYGAHLHLERRSAGQWKGAPLMKDCGKGLGNCYFNPNPDSFVP